MPHRCRFDDVAPDGQTLTAYDEIHLSDYLRLLDEEQGGKTWRDLALSLFELDPATEPERAERMHASHLARARWMSEVGYAHLLGLETR